MATKTVKQVKHAACSVCGRKKFVSLPVPDPFICKACRVKVAVAQALKPPAKTPPVNPRDPFTNDTARRAAINAASERGEGGWVPRRPGWLRRGRG